MKKLGIISFVFVILLSIVGCGNNEIKKDIESYMTQVKEIAPQEEAVIKAYDSISGSNYTDDETLYNGMDENVITQYRDFVENVVSIEPKTSELRNVHEIYIEAVNSQLKAFNQIMQALEEQDRELVNQANDNLSKASKLMRDYKFAFEELALKNGYEKKD